MEEIVIRIYFPPLFYQYTRVSSPMLEQILTQIILDSDLSNNSFDTTEVPEWFSTLSSLTTL